LPIGTLGERGPIQRIVVRIQVGESRMAGTDDPVFLRLEGAGGREFRLDPASGKAFHRGKEHVLVLGSPDSDEASVSHADLNDPTRPAIALGAVEGVRLIKALNPIPNVRGVGELDDRLLVEEIAVELYGADGSEPVRFGRTGPIWLGLVCGLTLELERMADGQ